MVSIKRGLNMKRIRKFLYIIISSLSLAVVIPSPISYSAISPVIAVQAKSTTVYVTPTGKKYHKKKCGNGTFKKSTLEKAKKSGLTACKKCY